MGWRLALPDTRKPLLLATVIFLAVLSALGALASLSTMMLPRSRFAVVGGPLFGALAYGLWRLHPAARMAAIVILVFTVCMTIFGGLGSLMYSAAHSKAEVLAWISPFVVVEYVCLYALAKYKSEFRSAGKNHA
jgi:hypothetical protein